MSNPSILSLRHIGPHFGSYLVVAGLCAGLVVCLRPGQSVSLKRWACLAIAHVSNGLWNDVFHSMDERWIFVGVLFVVHEVLWITINPFLLLCDRYGWFIQWKIMRKDTQQQSPSTALVVRSIKQEMISHLTTQLLALWFLYPLCYYAGTRSIGPIPNVITIVWQVTLAAIVNDALFYLFHVILHTGPFYSRIHKQHHEFRATTGFAAGNGGVRL